MCHNSSTCHAYVMWAELGHSNYLYVPAVSKYPLEMAQALKIFSNGTVRFGLCLVTSLLSTALLL